jgi:hypothetical protein
VLVAGAVASLALSQFFAYHDVRVERDHLTARQRRVVSPEKVFELTDLIDEVQRLTNYSYEDADFGLRLEEFRSRAYEWIDREAPEFRAAVSKRQGLGRLRRVQQRGRLRGNPPDRSAYEDSRPDKRLLVCWAMMIACLGQAL